MCLRDISVRLYLVLLATILIHSLMVRHLEETRMGMCILKDD